MAEKMLSAPAAQKFYDRIGSRYDWFEFYEARAKEQAFEALQLVKGLNVLSVGVGTGKELEKIKAAVSTEGSACGLDLSAVMALTAKKRVGSTICRADARQIPFPEGVFDRLYAGYILDLLPYSDLEPLLLDFWRVLVHDGKLVILALTEGINLPSKALVALWKTVFELSPAICGGCRPLELQSLVREAGFSGIQRRVIVQAGVPSELVTACKH